MSARFLYVPSLKLVEVYSWCVGNKMSFTFREMYLAHGKVLCFRYEEEYAWACLVWIGETEHGKITGDTSEAVRSYPERVIHLMHY